MIRTTHDHLEELEHQPIVYGVLCGRTSLGIAAEIMATGHYRRVDIIENNGHYELYYESNGFNAN